jgi:hypothetical protein
MSRPTLPRRFIRRLDRDGTVRGKTWRDMPGRNIEQQCLNWWLWKRNQLDLRTARAEADAAFDYEQTPLKP